MDQQLRELRRQALSGDPSAALQYFYFLKRFGPRSEPSRVDPTIIQIQRPRLRGPVEIIPLSGTRIYFVSPSEPNAYGGSNQVPLTVYNVDYYLRSSYYYYPELGWTPHSPENVAHAREHYQKRITEMKQQGWTGPGTWPDERTLQWYLQRPGYDAPCFSCGSHSGSSTFYATRANRYDSMGQAAVKLLNPVLIQLAQDFADEHPDLMLQAELQHLNEKIQSLDEDVEKERVKLLAMEQQLANLVIRELQAENQARRRRR